MVRPGERFLSVTLGIWLLQAAAYFVPPASWNPVSRFALTHAIVEEGQLSIDTFAEATGDRALREGHWYTDKSPTVSMLAVPMYVAVRTAHRLMHRPAPTITVTLKTPDVPAIRVDGNPTFMQLLYVSAIATSALPFAALGVALYVFLRRRVGPQAAFIGMLFTVLGTPLYPYATSLFGHELSAASLFGAVALADAPSPRTRSHVLVGALVGLSLSTEYLTALPGAVILLWCVWRAPNRLRTAALMAAGGAVPTLVVAAYNFACFGAPWLTGYSFVVAKQFAAGHSTGLLGVGIPQPEALWGLLFSESRGLVVVAPVSLLGIVGVVLAWRHRRDEFARCFTIAALTLLIANSGYYMWWGGAAAGPRHLVPVLPVLGLGIAHLWQHTRWARPLILVTGVFSLVVMVQFCAIGIEAPEQRSALSGYLWPAFMKGKLEVLSGASNLGVRLGLPVAGSLGPLFAWLLLGGRFLFVGLSAEEHSTEANVAT